VKAGPPDAAAASARSTYVSTDMPDQCGAITMPTARVIPSARISATVSAMNGGECFMPR
jgi:hypothetical protein